jgi:hypothetical protein
MIPHNSLGIQLAVKNPGEKKKREVFRGGRGCTSQRTRIRTPRRQTGSSLGRESKTRQKPFDTGSGKNVRCGVRLVRVALLPSGPRRLVRENTIGNHQLTKNFSLLPPIYLKNIINYFTPNQTSTTREEAYIGGLLIVLSIFLRALIYHIMILELSSFGMKIRIACCSLVYRKLMKLRSTTLQKITLGQVVNLLSNDAGRFDNGFAYWHHIWTAPIKMIIITYFLVVSYGYKPTVGLSAPLLYLLIQSKSILVPLVLVYTNHVSVLIYKKIFAERMRVAERTDYRIRLLSDMLNGIRAIKMFAWEKHFATLVNAARRYVPGWGPPKNYNFFQI